ncbi:MAG: hypothetical protein HY655_08310 [Acidobacteria bacterium]|nr:hypothetical protein [Acidobacteriota bacterium]
MLDAAFDDGFSDDDWQHALGGLHVWLTEAGGIISYASIIDRALVCAGERLQAGYVEAVATAAARRGQGHGTTVMRRVGELIAEGIMILRTPRTPDLDLHGLIACDWRPGDVW